MTSSGWRAKVARARQLAAELERAVEAFLDDETFSASVRAEGNDGVLRVDRLSDVPEHVALLLGDVIHNARCALDHVVWDLASTGGGTAGRPPSDGDALVAIVRTRAT